MLRNSYFQSVGNPLQFDRLPPSRPTLLFADRNLPVADAASHIVGTTIAMGVVSLVATGIRFASNNGTWPELSFQCAALLVALLIMASIGSRVSRRPFLPVGSIFTLIVALLVSTTAMTATITAALMLACLTWHVMRHYAYLATMAPLPRELAAEYRRHWNGYVAVVAIFFIAAVAFGVDSESPVILLAAIFGLPLVSMAAAWLKCPFRGSGRVGIAAVVSWLKYGSAELSIPGVATSPVGPAAERVVLMMLAHYVIAGATYEWGRALGFLNSELALITIFVPLPITWLVPFGIAFPIFLEAARLRATTSTTKYWPELVEHLVSSSDSIERDSIYVGNVVADQSPMLVPIAVYKEHAHYLGDSGSRKTSQGIIPTVEQLLGRGECSLVFVDLKADTLEPLAALNAAAQVARDRTGGRVPVKHFTNQIEKSTFAFNAMTQKIWSHLPLQTRTDMLTSAMGLQYGTDYGQGYFSTANSALMHEALKINPDVRSFQELAEIIGDVSVGRTTSKGHDLHAEIRKAGVHVLEVVKRLASFEALNVTAASGHDPKVLQHQIELSDVFLEPQVLYLHLSATLSPGSAPEIARLFTNLLLASSTPSTRRVPVFLVIDEFQRMIASKVESMLQLARSMGVGVILANQSLQDLKTSTTDLIPAIEANCRFRQWFSVSSSADRELLMAGGGEAVEFLTTVSNGWSGTNRTSSVSVREDIKPRLSVNDVLLASDHPRRSIVRISRGEGYAQYGGFPVVVESDFHITAEEYQRRKEFPWPTNVPGTFVPQLETTRPATPPISGPRFTTEIIINK